MSILYLLIKLKILTNGHLGKELYGPAVLKHGEIGVDLLSLFFIVSEKPCQIILHATNAHLITTHWKKNERPLVSVMIWLPKLRPVPKNQGTLPIRLFDIVGLKMMIYSK